MAVSERLAFLITANADQAIKAFEKTGKAAERELGKAEEKLDKLGGQLTKFGAASLATAGVAGAALFKMAEAAGNLNAAVAASEQVMGDAAKSYRRWAQDSVQAVGLSERAAIEAGTQFAGLGKIIGLTGEDLSDFSAKHVQLAADMAAFKDISPEQAIQDLQSAFAGSTEVMRKYNVFLDDAALRQAYLSATGEKVTGTLTAQQRIIATHHSIMEQSADMHGQWARESGELASQQAMFSASMENLQAAIGQGVLPMATELLERLNDLVGVFTGLDPAVQEGIGKFGAYAVAAAGVVGALSLIAGQAIKARDRFTTLGADGTRSLNRLGKAAGAAGLALGALAVIDVLNSSFHAFNKTAAKSEAGLSRLTILAADGEATQADLAEAVFQSAREVEGLGGKMTGARIQIGEYRASIGQVVQRLEDLNNTDPEGAKLALEAVRAEVENLRDTTKDVPTALDAKSLLGDLGEMEQRWLENAEAAQILEDRVSGASGAMDGAADAADGAADSIGDVGDEAANTAKEIDTMQKRFEGLLGVLDAQDAILDMADQFDDVRDAAETAAEAQETGGRKAEEANRRVARETIDLKREVIDYADAVGGIPEEAVTEILAMIDQGRIDEAERRLAELSRTRRVYLDIIERSGSSSIGTTMSADQAERRVGGRAHGGTTKAGEAYVVGEAGPELMVPGDGRVVSQHEIRQALLGKSAQGSTVNHITHNWSIDGSRDWYAQINELWINQGGLLL